MRFFGAVPWLCPYASAAHTGGWGCKHYQAKRNPFENQCTCWGRVGPCSTFGNTTLLIGGVFARRVPGAVLL